MTDNNQSPEDDRPSFFDFAKKPDTDASDIFGDDSPSAEELFGADSNSIEETSPNEGMELLFDGAKTSTESSSVEKLFTDAEDIIAKHKAPEPSATEAELNLDDSIDAFDLDDVETDELFANSSSTPNLVEAVAEENINNDTVDAALFEAFSEDYQSPAEEATPVTFKAYASYDYADERTFEDGEDEEEKEGIELDRPVIILILVLLLVGGWFVYDNFIARKYDGSSKRRKRKPRKEKFRFRTQEPTYAPVWQLAGQKTSDFEAETDLIDTIEANAGRKNPFSIPGDILAEMRQTIEDEDEGDKKKPPPKVSDHKAFRATLIGILSAEENLMALVKVQEAKFKVVEGTSEEKVLNTAIRQMSRSKANVTELFEGDTIAGFWVVDEIDLGYDTGTEGRVTIKRGEEMKTLRLNKAEELGIYDLDGNLTDFLEPEE